MKKIILTFAALASLATAGAQGDTYRILHECDTTVKCELKGLPLGSRDIHYIVYEYPSKDTEGKDATVSGVVMVPTNVADGTDPCDGMILYNHYTLDNLDDAPSVGKNGLMAPNMFMANPMKPNYILVASDFVGFGSSADRRMSYMTGETNARNSLDGLLAARQILADKQLPQGKYLFNIGYSQGANEAMNVAKLRDMEYKDKGVTFDKTFVGGGAFDLEVAYKGVVTKDYHPMWKDVVSLLVWANENHKWGLKYDELFQEPVASKIEDYLKTKNMSTLDTDLKIDSLHQVFQPDYMNLTSDKSKALQAKLKEIYLTNGWTIDPTQNYFIAHSRHDDYIPVQSSRSMVKWMNENGFKQSVVPGKTTLQTNMLLFKLDHIQSGIAWIIQTAAAIQFWPVAYYEGEQNRYLHNAVKDLNLMKTVKLLESLGINLRRSGGSDGESSDIFSVITKITNTLETFGLTLTDFYEMLEDSGVSVADLTELITYLTSDPAQAPAEVASSNAEGPLYLLRLYEQTLANWFLLGGYDVEYNKWGW